MLVYISAHAIVKLTLKRYYHYYYYYELGFLALISGNF